MDEYSLETKTTSIYHAKTKEYFAEVLSSYQQCNYRSATVMLWSVAVCDLLLKLKHLVDMYGDEVATTILSEVREAQEKNPKSSEWESQLVDKVYERTQLLEKADVDGLVHLQKQRHLSAHPVLSRDMVLHRPNRETVRALIRNTLDGLLTKPPIYTKKVFDELVADLATSSPMLIDDAKLKLYLESKYLSRTDTKVELGLARSLWKLVFRLSNPECDENREINFRTLSLLYRRNRGGFEEMVLGDTDYFSNVSQAGKPITLLVRFLSKHSELYDALNAASHVIIGHEVENNPISRCLAWFTSDSLEEHGNAILKWIDGDEVPEIMTDTFAAMSEISDSEEWAHNFHAILSAYYCKSYNFNMADRRFTEAIEPYLESFDRNDLFKLIDNIEKNNQCYSRGAAARDHVLVKDRFFEVGGSVEELREFHSFLSSCTDS